MKVSLFIKQVLRVGALILTLVFVTQAMGNDVDTLKKLLGPNGFDSLNDRVRVTGVDGAEKCMEQPAGTKPDPNTEAGWAQAGYGNPKITKMDLYAGDKHRYTHETDLDIVVVRGSGWTKEIIQERYKKVVKIYRQCNLKFSNMRVIEVDPPLDTRPPPPPRLIETFKPGNYFAGSSSGTFAERVPSPPARIVNLHVPKIAGAQTGVAGLSALAHGTLTLNKQWISSAILNLDRKEDHCLEGHEMGHIFLNCTHGFRLASETADERKPPVCDHTPGNVMANGTSGGSIFTKNQCDEILKHGSLKRL
jgi:hypothetical protein